MNEHIRQLFLNNQNQVILVEHKRTTSQLQEQLPEFLVFRFWDDVIQIKFGTYATDTKNELLHYLEKHQFRLKHHYYLDDHLHRVDGPAYEDDCGTKVWYLHGERHRVDGPAIIFPSGSKEWFIKGKRHREDGPAVEGDNGYKAWYLNDVQYTEEEFKAKTKKHEQLSQEDGEPVHPFSNMVDSFGMNTDENFFLSFVRTVDDITEDVQNLLRKSLEQFVLNQGSGTASIAIENITIDSHSCLVSLKKDSTFSQTHEGVTGTTVHGALDILTNHITWVLQEHGHEMFYNIEYGFKIKTKNRLFVHLEDLMIERNE